jgi:mannitol-specific phosphotransferase system IIBC component
MYPHHDHSTALGTVTGTVLTVVAQIDSHDYLKTVILAMVGAIVSFVVTLFLKWVVKKAKR